MRKPFRKEEAFKKKSKYFHFFYYERYENTFIFFNSEFHKENKMVLLHFILYAITVTMPFTPDNTGKNHQL